MLEGGNDDVAAGTDAVAEGTAFEGQIVALGPAAGEDQLLRIAADQRRFVAKKYAKPSMTAI